MQVYKAIDIKNNQFHNCDLLYDNSKKLRQNKINHASYNFDNLCSQSAIFRYIVLVKHLKNRKNMHLKKETNKY